MISIGCRRGLGLGRALREQAAALARLSRPGTYFDVAALRDRATIGTLQTSTCPAGTLNHSSLRFRRASTYAVNVGVSVRNTSNSVRCDAGRSAATRTDLIGSLCSGFS